MAWQVLSSKEIYRNRWLWLTEDEVKLDSGHLATYAVFHKKPFALIIPWDGERFTLVGQYRYQIRSHSWEFPQGHFEHTSIEETANRELKEETGMTARKIETLASFYVASGAIDQECHVFLATELSNGESELEESEEGLETKQVTLSELQQLIRGGELKDGPTIAALSYFLMERGI